MCQCVCDFQHVSIHGEFSVPTHVIVTVPTLKNVTGLQDVCVDLDGKAPRVLKTLMNASRRIDVVLIRIAQTLMAALSVNVRTSVTP